MFFKTGSWLGSEKEYKKIIHGMITSPKYLTLNIFKSFTYGCDQLFRNEIGQGLSAYNNGSAPYGQITWRFPNELNNYINSRQNRWNGAELNLTSLNSYNLIINIISLFCLLFIFFTSLYKRIDILQLQCLLFFICAIIINSMVTAGLIAPCSRFQARVVWLLPLIILIILFKNINQIKTMLKQN